MTKEELVNEAEKSLDKRLGTYAYIRKQDCYTNYVDGYIDSAEPREKRIEELEKENAELKEKLGDVQMQKAGEKSDLVWKLKTANEQKTEQLTKAKELLKRAQSYTENLDDEADKLYDEIEQFLNSEVEK
jgi:hypothetical protein